MHTVAFGQRRRTMWPIHSAASAETRRILWQRSYPKSLKNSTSVALLAPTPAQMRRPVS